MLRHARTLRYRDPRAGSSMVEFALVGIIVLMLVIGIFEVGRTVWSYNTLASAARQLRATPRFGRTWAPRTTP
ncbi:MAG: pilus assembly protein [Bryobacterales bacterium]